LIPSDRLICLTHPASTISFGNLLERLRLGDPTGDDTTD
jgi:hypothetical protein